MLRLRFYFCLTSIFLVSLLPLIQAQGAVNVCQSTAVTTAGQDDIELISVVHEYFNALRNKDWQRLDAIQAKRFVEVIINESDSHGPFLPYNASLELTKRLLDPYKIETLDYRIYKLEMKGQKAIVQVKVTMRVYDPNTGAKVIDFVDLERALYLDKYQSVWKLTLDAANGTPLDEQIKKAKTSVEQQFLLSQENLSVLNQAGKRLKKEGIRLLKQESLDQAFIAFGLAQEIEAHLRKRATVAAETRSKQRMVGVTKYRTSGQQKELALNLMWAGQDYSELKDYVKAQSYFNESIQLLEQFGDKLELANAYGEIAAVYLEQGKYSQAISSYQDSIDTYLRVAAEDKKEQSVTISDIDDMVIKVAYLYSAQGKYEVAETFVLGMSEKLEKLGKAEDAILLSYIIAILRMARGDNMLAAGELEQLLFRIDQNSQRIEDKDEILAGIRLILILLYSQQSNFAVAAQQFEKMRQAKVKTEEAIEWSNLLQFMDGLVYGAQGNDGLMVSRFKKVMPTLMDTGLEDFSVPDVLQISCMGYLSQSAFEDELPQKDFNLALQCFQFSAVMAEKVDDKIHIARAHQFIAGLYANKKITQRSLNITLKGYRL